jgi:hypothetical protein
MVSNGGGWVYNTSAVFPLDRDVNGNGVITAAENAGNSDRANPGEDWAWSFETYYRFRIGELDAATASRMAGKFALIEAFLASMG